MTACSVDGCRNEAQRAGICWGHLKQRQRRRTLGDLQEARGPRGRLRPFDRLLEAALVLIEVRPTDSAGWKRARNRLRRAADLYVAAKARAPRPRKG